ncbi:hypothetical protein MMIC_P2133 [Mariprofundus micogutta]|uniref:Uncharacterized protein n=1 Tax=Mariprofundus micogutta TaxID=1921010 RepID=A0A1L8CQI9_9PROT|nr:hypothetical protein MMIC_P2133 [Mariprofundus micogutta]
MFVTKTGKDEKAEAKAESKVTRNTGHTFPRPLFADKAS